MNEFLSLWEFGEDWGIFPGYVGKIIDFEWWSYDPYILLKMLKLTIRDLSKQWWAKDLQGVNFPVKFGVIQKPFVSEPDHPRSRWISCVSSGALPKTDIFAPAHRPKPKGKIIFQPPIFRGYVSLEGNWYFFPRPKFEKIKLKIDFISCPLIFWRYINSTKCV